VEICAVCCAEGRLKTIACPVDCSYLQSEHYQQARRTDRAFSHGRQFLENVAKAFPERRERDVALKIYADIYYFASQVGSVEDREVVDAVRALQDASSQADGGSSSPPVPLTLYLRERLADQERYPGEAGPGSTSTGRVLAGIADRARSLAGERTRFLEKEMSTFFDALDFEADLDYSPRDGKDPSAPLYGESEGSPRAPAT
jgi:hypothetical protein